MHLPVSAAIVTSVVEVGSVRVAWLKQTLFNSMEDCGLYSESGDVVRSTELEKVGILFTMLA